MVIFFFFFLLSVITLTCVGEIAGTAAIDGRRPLATFTGDGSRDGTPKESRDGTARVSPPRRVITFLVRAVSSETGHDVSAAQWDQSGQGRCLNRTVMNVCAAQRLKSFQSLIHVC